MISRSVAASSASSSSWRSSLRGSRSPTWGSSSIRSSPSRGALRGKAPSSSPSRQTTRCGTERIGISVQTVRWPVRKLARVGRPWSRCARWARTSAGASSGRGGAGRAVGGLLHHLVEHPLQLGALPALARAGVGQGVGGGADRLAPVGQRLGFAEGVEGVAEARDQLGQAPGEVDRAAVDVVEREHALEQPLAVLGHRHAEQQPVQAGVPGAARHPLELVGRAVAGVQAPADPGLRDPVLQLGEVVVVEPEAPADRRRGRPGRAPGRRSAAARRARAAARRRPGPGWSGAASGRPGGRAGRPAAGAAGPARAASSSGQIAGAEGGLDQRGEGLDVRAHHDHVARLERLVVGERVQDRVAHHLDLARPAVAGVDLEAAVVGRQQRAGVRAAGQRRAGRRPVGADVGLDPPQQRRRRSSAEPWCSVSRRRRPRRGRAASRGRRGPRRRAAGWRAARRWGPRRAGPRAGRRRRRRPVSVAARGGQRSSHSAGEGCSRNRCTSRPCASARRICRWPAGRRVSPNSAIRRGSVTSDGSWRSRSQARWRRSAGPGRPIRARRRRHSSACQRAPAGSSAPTASVSLPCAQACTIWGRCRA